MKFDSVFKSSGAYDRAFGYLKEDDSDLLIAEAFVSKLETWHDAVLDNLNRYGPKLEQQAEMLRKASNKNYYEPPTKSAKYSLLVNSYKAKYLDIVDDIIDNDLYIDLKDTFGRIYNLMHKIDAVNLQISERFFYFQHSMMFDDGGINIPFKDPIGRIKERMEEVQEYTEALKDIVDTLRHKYV